MSSGEDMQNSECAARRLAAATGLLRGLCCVLGHHSLVIHTVHIVYWMLFNAVIM